MKINNNKLNSTTKLLATLLQTTNKLSKTNLTLLIFFMSAGVFADQQETFPNQNAAKAVNNGVEFELANFGIFAAIVTVFVCCLCCVNKCHKYYANNQQVFESNSLTSNNVHLSDLKPTVMTSLLFKQPNRSISSEGNSHITNQIDRQQP